MKKFEVVCLCYGEYCTYILKGHNIKEIKEYCAMYINGDIISLKEIK